jgi:TonB family protein
MKNPFLLTILVFQLTFGFGQSETLYSEQGVTLSYSATKFNTIELQNDFYDQYEVKIRFSNSTGRYIHQPRICRIGFSKDINHPSSNSDFDFVQSGEAYGYFEYTDGTQLPVDLDSPIEDEKYGRVVSRMIIAPNNSDECTKFVLVKSGNELERPTFSVEFNNSYPVIVSGTNSLINTWVERQAKGVSLKNIKYWPLTSPQHDINCGNARPIGNKGDLKNSNNLPSSFKGDINAFIKQNLKYPILAVENDIQGKVVVSFVIDKSGNAIDIKAISGPKELYEAAENVIRKTNGMWIPAKENNKFVSVSLTVPINFQLN